MLMVMNDIDIGEMLLVVVMTVMLRLLSWVPQVELTLCHYDNIVDKN
jgi:hypothetical protein